MLEQSACYTSQLDSDEDRCLTRFCGVNGRIRRSLETDVIGAEHNRLDTTAISQKEDVEPQVGNQIIRKSFRRIF